jgi:hypothetical protein
MRKHSFLLFKLLIVSVCKQERRPTAQRCAASRLYYYGIVYAFTSWHDKEGQDLPPLI